MPSLCSCSTCSSILYLYADTCRYINPFIKRPKRDPTLKNSPLVLRPGASCYIIGGTNRVRQSILYLELSEQAALFFYVPQGITFF
nr:MAG TPA: hypothetical protein [Caudoviricetes sp.]